MKKFVKILSVLMSAVILVTALCVPVSAASIEDTAKAIDSGKKVSLTLKEAQLLKCTYYDYKVTLSEKGTLKLSFSSNVSRTGVKVLDSNGNPVELSSKSVSTGSAYYYSRGYANLIWNSTMENFKGSISYKSLEKGTYYVRIWAETSATVKGKTSVSFSYPQETEEETASEGKISYLSVTLKAGDTLQLGAVVDGEGTVTWSTSKKAVATVTTKGKITAKSAGTAIITAKLGSSSVKIKVKVTE